MSDKIIGLSLALHGGGAHLEIHGLINLKKVHLRLGCFAQVGPMFKILNKNNPVHCLPIPTH
jgi:hypothetical protein